MKMPVLFVGHGSPMNAIEHNEFSYGWRKIVEKIPRPKAILCISAHETSGKVAKLSTENPKTVHDFYGFPEKLFEVNYPARGSFEYAQLIKNAVKTVKVDLDDTLGFDHGTWSVLVHMYPKADIPVLQLSLNENLPLEKAFKIGQELKKLREKGLFIIGSGNIVHNLSMMDNSKTEYPWAKKFNDFVKEKIVSRDFKSLFRYRESQTGVMAQPTEEHFVPLIYILGATEKEEKPEFFNDKIFYGSISMTSVIFGLN